MNRRLVPLALATTAVAGLQIASPLLVARVLPDALAGLGAATRVVDASALRVTRSATAGIVLVDVATANGEGAGTGMVIDADGLVLTNYHVVQGSTQVRVTIADTGEAYTATVVGHDAARDVALLQLADAHDLATVRLDASHEATPGEQVTAIGNGGGTGVLQTATGVVEATDRAITVNDETSPTGTESLSGLVESTVGIVPGYSGGPLFDAEGTVIGINTAGSTSGRVVDAYAIPIGDALAVVDVIRSGTEQGTTRIGPGAALGVTVTSSLQASRSRYAGMAGRGALVAGVVDGGAADRAGLTRGSTITRVDGHAIATTVDLAAALAPLHAGDVVDVTWTDAAGTSHTAQVTLGQSSVN